MGIGVDDRAIADRAARAEEHAGLDHHVAADLRVERHEHRLGRDHRRARPHGGLAQAALHDGLRGGELHPIVDAHRLFLARHDGDAAQPPGARGFDDVGEVILPLGVVVADGLDQRQRLAPVDGHDARIAGARRQLGRGRVLLLADRNQFVALDDEAPVAGRVGRRKAHRRHGRAVGERAAQGGKRGGREERRVAEDDQQVVVAPRNRLAGGKRGVRRPEPLGLDIDVDLRSDGTGGLRHVVAAGTDDHREGVRAGACAGGQDVGQHGLARNPMKHLGKR